MKCNKILTLDVAVHGSENYEIDVHTPDFHRSISLEISAENSEFISKQLIWMQSSIWCTFRDDDAEYVDDPLKMALLDDSHEIW